MTKKSKTNSDTKDQKLNLIELEAPDGELELLQNFLSLLPPNLNNTAILIPESLNAGLTESISQTTDLEVIRAESGLVLESGNVYIVPSGKDYSIEDSKLNLFDSDSSEGSQQDDDQSGKSGVLSAGLFHADGKYSAIRMLQERRKEQIALYDISKLNGVELTVDEILNKSLQILKNGFFEPDNTGIQISFNGKEYSSDNIGKIANKISANSTSAEGNTLTIEAGLIDTSKKEDLKFLQEEVELIEAAADILSLKLFQKHTRKELEKSNQRFNYALEASDDVIYEHDMVADTIILSENFQRIFGYSFAEEPFTLEKWAKLLHPDDEERINTRLEEILSDRTKNKWEAEFRYQKKDGTYANVSENTYIIRDHAGKPVRMIGVVKDVTKTKQRELKNELSSNISRIFNESETLNAALKGTLYELRALGHFQFAEFWLTDSDHKWINLVAYIDKDTGSFYEVARGIDSFKKGEGLPGKTWKSKKTEFWKNLDTRKSFIRRESAAKAGLKTGYGFPILYNKEVTGVLLLGTDETLSKQQPFTGIFEELASQLGEEIHRKKIEEELSRIYSSAPDGIIVAGFDGYFKKVNPAMCDILGYTEEELLSKSFLEFVHPDDREKTIQFYEDVNKGANKTYFENRYIRKSGKVVWIAWTFKIFYREKIAYIVAKDITAQKELEELMSQANKLAKIGSWEVDLVTGENYWSEMTREIHEVNPDFVPKLETAINFYKKGESRQKISKAVNVAIEKGEGWDLELKIITAKGNERWVRAIGEAEMVDGECVRVFGSFQDIHDMKLAQTRLDNTADNLPGVLFQYWLTPDGKDSVRYLSEGSLEVWGVTAEDAMEDFDRVWAHAHKEDVEAIRQSIIESAETQSMWHHIWRYIHPDGSLKWQEGFGTPQKLDDGTVFWDSIILDVTEKKEFEELLEQSSRLAKVGSWNVDVESGLVFWSETSKEIFEVESTDDLDSDKVFEFVPDASDREKLQMAAQKAVESGESYDLEILIRTAKGNEKWIRTIGEPEFIDGKCVRVYGSVQDIHDRKSAEEKLKIQSRHLEAISKLKSALLDYRDWYNALDENLHIIGEAVGSDRVYYFENRFDPETGEGYTTQKLEWCREGITPQQDNPELVEMHFSNAPELIEPMLEKKPSTIRLSDIEKGTATRHIMESQQIKTCLTIPVYVENRFHGFVGFDNCTNERFWSDEERDILETITGSLTTAISRQLQDEKLQELLEEKKTILESISDAFYAVDKEWRITYFNNEAEKELKLSASEVLGKNLWDMFPTSSEADINLKDVYRQVIKRKEKQAFEYFSPELNSWYDMSVYPSANGVSVYFKNITNRKKEQRLILEKTNQINAIATFNSLLITKDDWLDALNSSLGNFGEVVGADRVYFFEYHKEESSDKMVNSMRVEWVRESIPPELDNPVHQNQEPDTVWEITGVLLSGEVYNRVVENISDNEFRKFLQGQDIKSILAFPVFVRDQFRGFIGFDDCTNGRVWEEEEISFMETISINLASAIENEDAELALQQAYEEKDSILESIGDGFFTLDSDFTVTYWNKKAEELLLIPREKILNQYFWDLFDKELAEITFNHHKKALVEQTDQKFEEFYKPLNRWFDVNVYPTAEGISVFFKDITDRKREQQVIEQKTDQLDAIAQFNGQLISEDTPFDALQLSFEQFGNIVEADRAYYFENNFDSRGEPITATMKLEWTREGVEAQADNPVHTDLPLDAENSPIEAMAQNKPFISIVDEIENEQFRNLLKEQDIKSVLSLPVFVGNKFHGFIGFDDCSNERIWSEDEIGFLKTISLNLAAALENEEAERELEKSFKEKNEILESIGDAFFAVDNEWTVTYWNNMAEEFLGMPKEKIVGKNLWDLYDDALELEFYRQYHKAVREQETVHFEEYYPATDNWFEVSAYPSELGLSVFFKDITERYKAIREIELSNERFMKVAEVSKDAIWDFNVKRETLIWGDGLKKLFGYDPETFGELTSWEDRIHKDDRERVIETFRDTMAGKTGPVWESEYRFLKADGSYAYIQDRGSVIRNEAGEVIRIVGTMSDVTEQKEVEETLRNLNESLKNQADELAASNAELEQFAFVASHDLQEPLRMITSFLAQLERKYNDVLDEKGKKYIYFATDGAKRMRQIILDLLDYSRIGRIDNEREKVDMNEILENVLILHRKKIKETAASVNTKTLPTVSAVRGAMQQLMQNLVSNALNYQDPGNKPEIDIWHEELDEAWKFYVKDNGIGIDPQYQDKIFNIFQRLHGREGYAGTGVGLAICKKIVEDHGGEIGVESTPGKGSTFKFTIQKQKPEY